MPADRLILLYRAKLEASDQFHHALPNALRGTPIGDVALNDLAEKAQATANAYYEFSRSLLAP